jgi:hypothetical protein
MYYEKQRLTYGEVLNRIIVALSENDEHLKWMCYAGEDKSDIYEMYKGFTGNLVSQLPTDEYYVMNNDGDITFIGNLKMLVNYVNKFTYRW